MDSHVIEEFKNIEGKTFTSRRFEEKIVVLMVAFGFYAHVPEIVVYRYSDGKIPYHMTYWSFRNNWDPVD